MTDHAQPDSAFAERIRDSFARQPLMRSLGAALARVEAGICDVRAPWSPALRSERGGVHPGVGAALLETAASYAAGSLASAGASLLTLEQKLDLAAPACGDALLASARVERAGPSLIVVRAELLAETGGARRTVAVLQSTMMAVRNGAEAPFTGHWHLNDPLRENAKAEREAA